MIQKKIKRILKKANLPKLFLYVPSLKKQNLSLKKQNLSLKKERFPKRDILGEILSLHSETMERLYNLSNTKHMIVDKSGIYPRIYFLQGSNPEEIRD